MKIEVFGTGCAKCQTLEQLARKVADDMGVDYELSKVSELVEIMNRGVMMTPALALDGEIKLSGKVPDEAELRAILDAAVQR